MGLGVSEVCEKCGFNDYSNFLKAFTKAVGVSPKKYGQYSAS
jgi:AraC-like DNA-binding protein